MTLEYIPNNGFKLNSDIFSWGDDRKLVREKLMNQHKVDDRIIEMAEFFDGDTSHDIAQKRDIYQDINKSKNYFFLSYDSLNKLNELEVHWGLNILINKINLEFENDISSYLDQFNTPPFDYLEIEEGNYLFKSLKMIIANSESTGGDGNGLSYFYAGRSIEHLIEE